MIQLWQHFGFEDVRITDRFDCFAGTSKEDVAREFGVHGINVFARRGTT